MKYLADANETKVLVRLLNEKRTQRLTIGETWTLFSWIKKEHSFKREPDEPPAKVSFTADEIKHLKSLKLKVRTALEQSSSRRCAYCKRAMGNYGYSWQIEHIKCKDRHPAQAFDMRNLALACIDCNSAKGQTVDRSDPYVYNIIDPKSKGFKYGNHLRFFHLATEDICFLKYRCLSPQGTATYTDLKLNVWERAETLKSVSVSHQSRDARLERILDLLGHDDRNAQLTQLLGELKILAFEK
jgi:5-methylcytosine-specific restriction endonuclease McrA